MEESARGREEMSGGSSLRAEGRSPSRQAADRLHANPMQVPLIVRIHAVKHRSVEQPGGGRLASGRPVNRRLCNILPAWWEACIIFGH